MSRRFPESVRRRPLAGAVAALLVAAAITAAALALRTSNAAHHGGASAHAAPRAIPVMVAPALAADVRTWDEFSGRLEAVGRVEIRSRVAGAVHSVHFREGALVKAGELLVTIDPAPYAAEADRAQAQAVAARARLEHATGELERAERLWKESAIAQRELDARVNAKREAEANLRAAEAALQSAKLNLSYTQVRAPISGRVGRLEVTTGNLVAAGPGAPVLTTLVSVDPMYASFEADEALVLRAIRDAAATPARLEDIPVLLNTVVRPDKPYRGHLQLVDNQVNAKTGTVRVRAVFPNPAGELMPGQFADIRLGRPKPTPAVLINERAVGTDQDRKFVLVVGEDNKAAYREVSLGRSVDGLRIVTSGLQAGERIVVNGLQRVRPGAVVQPEAVQMAAAASTPPRR